MPLLSLVTRHSSLAMPAVGVASICFVFAAGVLATLYRDESRRIVLPPKTQYITQATEDALRPNTLESLLGHYNYSIRDTASRIICDRAANDDATVKTLIAGITRPDYAERIRSLKALALITDYNNLKVLHTKRNCLALVRCLEHCRRDVEHEELDDKYYDEYFLRDMAERLGLMFVSQLMAKFGTRMLVEAKFVEKWLSKQRWGVSDEERQRHFSAYVESKNNRLKDICKQLQESRDGRKALQEAGLLSRSRVAELENSVAGNRVSVILEIQVPARDGEREVGTESSVDIPLGMGQSQNLEERIRNNSAELRRQHRQAMVLNDGTRPLGRDDIIENRVRESPN